MSKATPGPWRVNGRYIEAIKEKFVAELPSGGILHAKVDAANAQLIALCPDMFNYIEGKAKQGDKDAAKIIASIGTR